LRGPAPGADTEFVPEPTCMSEDRENSETPKRQIGGELIIPAAALIFTLYYFSTIVNSPWTAQVNAFMVGFILIAVILIFLVARLRLVLAGRATFGFADMLAPRKVLPKRAAFAAICLLYVAGIAWLGYTLTTFLFLWSAMALLGDFKRIYFCAAISAFMTLVGYAVFIALFETRLPRGVIEKALAGLF